MKLLTKQTYIAGLSALMIVFTLTLAGATYANWQGEGMQNNPELKEKMEAVQASIESGDYSAFRELVDADERSKARFEGITEENFGKFQEAHQLMNEAKEKMEAAHAIMEELGLDHGPGKRFEDHEGEGGHEFKGKRRGRGGFGKRSPQADAVETEPSN